MPVLSVFTRVSPWNHVSNGGPGLPTERGTFGGKTWASSDLCTSSILNHIHNGAAAMQPPAASLL